LSVTEKYIGKFVPSNPEPDSGAEIQRNRHEGRRRQANSLREYDAIAKSNVDEFLFCRKAGSSTLPKRLYPER